MSARPVRLLVTLATCLVLELHAGKPLPAHRYPQSRRDASMALLLFQNAIAADQWDKALALCSTEVQSRAKDWPSAETFFKETMPLEHVLARDFSCWSCGDKFYGMFETISAYDEQPRLDWFWGIAFTSNGKWEIDFPPMRLTAYVTQRKAMLKAHDEDVATLRRALDKKTAFISTRLVPLNNRFKIDAPMQFRVELTNAGPTSVHYVDNGLSHYGLVVRDLRTGNVVSNTAGPAQIAVRTKELQAHSAVTLAEALDIAKNHRITEDGRYSVQFDGSTLQIGQQVPMQEHDRFGRNIKMAWSDLFPATNKFPSNVVEIEVRR